MTVHPSPNEYAELELILDGVLPGPLSVSVSAEPANADRLELTDAEGTPIARLTVTARDGSYVTGPVEPLQAREDGIFRHLRRTPARLRSELGGQRAVAVVVDAPLDTATLERLARASKDYDVIVLLPTIADGAQQLVSPAGLVRATLAVVEAFPVPAIVVPVPVADPAPARRLQVAAAYGDPLDIAPATERLAAIGYALSRGRMLKADLVPPAVAAILRAERPPRSERGLVVLFTGLSGSGKSTLARRLRDHLLERGERTVTLLDGDVVRRMLSAGLGFSRADREANVRRIGFVAAEVARAGGIAICAPIAPYASTRAEVRAMVAAAGANFVIVHVATPLAECERRDRKGLYARARAGEIPEFTGISDPYEAPDDADLVLDTTGRDLESVADEVLALLTTRGIG